MRKDMRYVVIERPRYGGYRDASNYKIKNGRGIPLKVEPTGRHRQFGWNAKELNDYLNPLYRFLDGKVGCKWDDVWSEIKEGLGGGGTLQQHVLGHVWGHVAKELKTVDGVVWGYYSSGNGSGGEPTDLMGGYRSGDNLYISLDGILCKTPSQKKSRGRNTKKFNGHSYHEPLTLKLHGKVYKFRKNAWFEDLTKTVKVYSSLYGEYVDKQIISFRQLNTKELKELGLK